MTGALTASKQIAEDRTAQLIEAARPLPVTFHRAFDACLDLAAALETLVALGVERVLITARLTHQPRSSSLFGLSAQRLSS